MKIALIYPGHQFSTYDVAEGHDKGLRELGHDVRSVRYDNAYGFYAESLQHWELLHPGWQYTADTAFAMASERTAIEVIDWGPDVALIVSATEYHKNAFSLMHKANIPIVAMFTESPYGDDLHNKVMAQTVLRGAFTNEKTTVKSLSDKGKIPVAYLPHSYQPDKHKSAVVENGHSTDVFFFGTLFPERLASFSILSESLRGMRYKFDGPAPNQKGVSPLLTLPNEELVKYYNGTKIALNMHRASDTAWSLGPRAYEIAACGAFQISDNRGELHELFNGSVPSYTNDEELAEVVRHYLSHPDERLEKAKAAHERVKDCTFRQRDAEIVVPFLEEVL